MKKSVVPLAMRRNCNLDLCLLPSGPADSLPSIHSSNDSMSDGSNGIPQQLTIFYNGRVSVCDVTELQARAIIWFARREINERMNTPGSEPVSSPLQSQLQSPPGISMKKSLQRFLQKRKNRIQATSPYKKD